MLKKLCTPIRTSRGSESLIPGGDRFKNPKIEFIVYVEKGPIHGFKGIGKGRVLRRFRKCLPISVALASLNDETEIRASGEVEVKFSEIHG